MYINCLFVHSYHCKSDCLFKATSKKTNTLSTVVRNVPEHSSQDLESLSQSLKLTVPSSVKECRRKGARELTRKARTDVIKNSLILLQASIGRENPSQSEFVVCAQKIIALVPELKDPLPPIHREAFKEWVSVAFTFSKYSISSIL